MDTIGAVICNYNKKEYLLKCIASLLRQTYQNIDIYVVDNASTDGSVEAVKEVYGDRVHLLLELSENIGGSGGFSAGMKQAMKRPYPYLMMLDNDVMLKEDCVEVLHRQMEKDSRLGIVGTKILLMDQPEIIQEFGPMLDVRTFSFDVCFRGEREDIPLPEVRICDYVPACALMVRRDVLDVIGPMPEENYLYFDDIEWCTRCRNAGWRVAAGRDAVSWHKGGAGMAKDTMSVYYMNRNKTEYYLRHVPEAVRQAEGDQKDALVDAYAKHLLDDMFQGMFTCRTRQLWNIYQTRMDGFLDALSGRQGRAAPYEIRLRDAEPVHPFARRLSGVKRVLLHMNGFWESTRQIIFELRKIALDGVEINLVEECSSPREALLGIPIRSSFPHDTSRYDMVLEVCGHVYERGKDPSKKYVDSWRNLLLNEEDFAWYEKYPEHFEMFQHAFADRLKSLMRC